MMLTLSELTLYYFDLIWSMEDSASGDLGISEGTIENWANRVEVPGVIEPQPRNATSMFKLVLLHRDHPN